MADKIFSIHRSVLKEFLDRIGYGFGSWQYVNIIFFAIGAPLYLIAAFNGIKVFLAGIFSSYANTLASASSRRTILSGVLLAATFFLLGYAANTKNLGLFFAAAIAGGCIAVLYVEQYQRIFRSMIEKLRKPMIASQMAAYGTVVTVVAMFFAAILLDRKTINYSSLLYFAGAAFLLATLASGFQKTEHERHRGAFSMLADQWREYRKSNLLVLILFCSSISGMVNTFGNAFYGIYIFRNMSLTGFGGFTNVAVIFMVGLLAVLLAPSITRLNSVRYGKFPMLVFGTLLMAILPLSYYYKPNLLSIALGTIIGIFGAAIVGTSQGLVIMDTLKEEDRKKFFRFNSAASVLPYILFTPLVCWLVQEIDIRLFFFVLSMTLACIVAPLYFVVVAKHQKRIV